MDTSFSHSHTNSSQPQRLSEYILILELVDHNASWIFVHYSVRR